MAFGEGIIVDVGGATRCESALKRLFNAGYHLFF